MFVDCTDSVWKMLFKQLIKIFIIIALLTIMIILSDTLCTRVQNDIKHVSKLSVISIDDINNAKKTNQEYILQDIALDGTSVHDPTDCFSGDYYYLDIYAEVCSHTKSSDGLSGGYSWSKSKTLCKKLTSNDLKVSCCNTDYFLKNVNTTRLYLDRKDQKDDSFVNINYYYPSGNADASEGNIRYSYEALPVDNTYSAWIRIENGKINFLNSDSNKTFIPGNSKAYIKYLNSCSDDKYGAIYVLFLIPSLCILFWIPISIVVWIKERFF